MGFAIGQAVLAGIRRRKSSKAKKSDAETTAPLSLKKRLHRASTGLSHIVVVGFLGASIAALSIEPDSPVTTASTNRDVTASDARVAHDSGSIDRVDLENPSLKRTEAAVVESTRERLPKSRAVTSVARMPVEQFSANDADESISDVGASAEGRIEPAMVPPVARTRPKAAEFVVARNGLSVEEWPLRKRLAERDDVKKRGQSKRARATTDPRDDAESEALPEKIGISRKRQPYLVTPLWTEKQIADARSACDDLLKGRDITYRPAEPLKQGACGAPAPVYVSRFGGSNVDVKPSPMLTCPMVLAIDKWLANSVQPKAKETLGSPVKRLMSVSSYSCRNRYGRKQSPISEHALVNALDLAGFELADGRTIKVISGWGPTARDRKRKPKSKQPETASGEKQVAVAVVVNPKRAQELTGLSKLGAGNIANQDANKDGKASVKATNEKNATKPDKKPEPSAAEIRREKQRAEQREKARKRAVFLRAVHKGACSEFGTVLGPEANDAHRDHFHFDMKHRRYRSYCQ